MEWLRAVDLAEYAPNLRGAGVHGGLMVLEPKFNAELLAALLAIPAGKTLLRRHLNTHFNDLLGKSIIQEKRETESIMGYIPLTPSMKLKVFNILKIHYTFNVVFDISFIFHQNFIDTQEVPVFFEKKEI